VWAIISFMESINAIVLSKLTQQLSHLSKSKVSSITVSPKKKKYLLKEKSQKNLEKINFPNRPYI
jgi:hypothetical protein